MTTRRQHPAGRRLFSEEQAKALIDAYEEGATQKALCIVAESMIGNPVSLSTIRNLVKARTYRELAANVG